MKNMRVGSKINKRLDHLEDRFSEGQSAYVLDMLGPMLEKKFIEEAAETFDAFKDLNDKPMPTKEVDDMRFLQKKDDDDDNDLPVPRVKINGLANGLTEFKWKVKAPATDLIRVYTKGFYREFMTPREFLGMAIELSVAGEGMEDCSNCLKSIREKIGDLFQIIDVSRLGQVDAEDLFRALDHMKDEDKFIKNYSVTSKMVNDFFLKTMEVETATINLPEFQYALMMGYMERMLDNDGSLNIKSSAEQITMRQ